jgi:hypothetical protein
MATERRSLLMLHEHQLILKMQFPFAKAAPIIAA